MMKTDTDMELTVASPLAGDDVRCGSFVAVLSATWEVPSYMWDAGQAMLPIHELVRLRLIPGEAGLPLKVFAVCLPFVYVKDTAGEVKTLDLRRHQLVRLNQECGKQVWNELKNGKKRH